MKHGEKEQKKQLAMNAIDIYGIRDKIGLTNAASSPSKKKSLADLVFSTDAFVLEKITEAKLLADLALKEAKQKREKVVFKHDGPT